MANNWNKLVYYYLAVEATYLLYLNPCQCTVIEGPRNVTYLPGLTPLPIELTCNVNGFPSWQVNGTAYRLDQLDDGILPGHNRTGTNILVNIPVNHTEYICVSQTNDGSDLSDPAYIIIAGVPLMVPNVMIDITFTLSWGEPFNNLDPIVSYTVSWNNGTFLQTFTSTDTTARNYTIPNLTPVTAYIFSVVATNSIGSGPAGEVMRTTPPGHPDGVPDVMINKDSIRIIGRIVTLTLSWGEPFSYFAPIISYTVSCLGSSQCAPDFITIDNTIRITNLTAMTNYTFSVVATNSFGSGEAGILDFTTPGISQVNGIELQCNLVNIINQCTVTWSWNSLLENVTNFLIISNVGRFNVSSQNTSHTFTVLSLPGGASSGEVTVIVIAVNELDQGPPSEVVTANITVPSVINAAPILVCTPAVSELYNITVTCTIHPNSTADQCVVLAMADGRVTRTGNTPITEGMATVMISDLQCGVIYNITAEGTLNETLVGSRSFHGSVNPGPCPVTFTVGKSDDELSTGAAVAISIVVTFIITLIVTALISVFITSLYYKHLIIKSAINRDGDSHSLTKDVKRNDPTYATASANITMDTNPAYGTTSTIKMDTNPAYATTSH